MPRCILHGRAKHSQRSRYTMAPRPVSGLHDEVTRLTGRQEEA
jgi:hypothetical protein